MLRPDDGLHVEPEGFRFAAEVFEQARRLLVKQDSILRSTVTQQAAAAGEFGEVYVVATDRSENQVT